MCKQQVKYWLFGFYGISTLLGYLMPNLVYIYWIYICTQGLFGWVLWHINACTLFNASSCLYISEPTVVEINLKAPFLIATTPRCRGELYSFPWIAPFTLDQYLIILSVKQGGINICWLYVNAGLPHYWWTL